MTCDIDLWPVYVGSDTQETKTNCIDYDKKTNAIIVGGTQNAVFTSESVGFVYALDQNANWLWGGTIAQGLTEVSEIVKCQMNSDSSLFTAFGLSGSKPVFIEIDTVTGEIKKFIELGLTEQ